MGGVFNPERFSDSSPLDAGVNPCSSAASVALSSCFFWTVANFMATASSLMPAFTPRAWNFSGSMLTAPAFTASM